LSKPPNVADIEAVGASGYSAELAMGRAASCPCLDDSAPGDNAFYNDAVRVSMNAHQTGSTSKDIRLLPI
jgi:hypothetical protein